MKADLNSREDALGLVRYLSPSLGVRQAGPLGHMVLTRAFVSLAGGQSGVCQEEAKIERGPGEVRGTPGVCMCDLQPEPRPSGGGDR